MGLGIQGLGVHAIKVVSHKGAASKLPQFSVNRLRGNTNFALTPGEISAGDSRTHQHGLYIHGAEPLAGHP